MWRLQAFQAFSIGIERVQGTAGYSVFEMASVAPGAWGLTSVNRMLCRHENLHEEAEIQGVKVGWNVADRFNGRR